MAYKTLVERNREKEREEGRPAENSVLYLPYIVVNTDKKTMIDCAISHDKYAFLFVVFLRQVAYRHYYKRNYLCFSYIFFPISKRVLNVSGYGLWLRLTIFSVACSFFCMTW